MDNTILAGLLLFAIIVNLCLLLWFIGVMNRLVKNSKAQTRAQESIENAVLYAVHRK